MSCLRETEHISQASHWLGRLILQSVDIWNAHDASLAKCHQYITYLDGRARQTECRNGWQVHDEDIAKGQEERHYERLGRVKDGKLFGQVQKLRFGMVAIPYRATKSIVRED